MRAMTRSVAYRLEPVVVLAFGVAWVLFVLVMLNASTMATGLDDGQQNAPAVVTLEGVGDDVSVAFDADFGLYRVAWYAPCDIRPVLMRWADDEVTELGRLRQGILPLQPGTYFVSVPDVACEWQVVISPT